MALLEVSDLAVRFHTEDGVVHAVEGISYSVDKGKVLGIVGESGSGKTVGSLTLLGLTRSKTTEVEGRALLDGQDLLTMTNEQLRRVRGNDMAMIFQDPLSSLHPFFRIGDQLGEAVRAHHPDVSSAAARDRAIEMLTQVGIPEPRDRLRAYPHEFSGGMRQRVMIAMALVNRPKLIIADEPTTALDVTVQAQILELLEQLREETGTAIVIITHDLGVVAQMADEIAVMYAGRIVEQAPARAIFEQPQHPYTWGLLRSIPRLTAPRDEELVPISGKPPSLINRPSGCHFHPRCPYVREAHTRVDPELVGTEGDPGHLVRCLLPAQTRRALWAKLNAGATPDEAIEAVPIEEAAGA
jgi:peptide/nickel transport system ATP-binding protein